MGVSSIFLKRNIERSIEMDKIAFLAGFVIVNNSLL